MDWPCIIGLILGLLAGAGIIGTNLRYWELDILGGIPLVLRIFILERIANYPWAISFLTCYTWGFVIGGFILGIAKFFGINF